MASKNDSDKDIIPMGKAIAIIIAVIGSVVLLIGGIFVFFALNDNNNSVANNNKQDQNTSLSTNVNNNEQTNSTLETNGTNIIPEIIGNWSDKEVFKGTPMEDLHFHNPYTYIFNADSSYELILLQFATGGDYLSVYEQGTYEVHENTLKTFNKSSSGEIYENIFRIDFVGNNNLELIVKNDDGSDGKIRMLTKIEKSPLQSFDIMVGNAVQILKKELKDPNSLQLHEVRFNLESEGVTVYFDYSAKNSFGGYNRSRAQVSSRGQLYADEIEGFMSDSIMAIFDSAWKTARIYDGELYNSNSINENEIISELPTTKEDAIIKSPPSDFVDAYVESMNEIINSSQTSETITIIDEIDPFIFSDFEISFGNNIKWDKVDNEFSEVHGHTVFALPVTLKNISSNSSFLSNISGITPFGISGIALKGVSNYFDDDVRDSSYEMRSGASCSGYMYFLYEGDGDYVLEFEEFRKEPHEIVLSIKK